MTAAAFPPTYKLLHTFLRAPVVHDIATEQASHRLLRHPISRKIDLTRSVMRTLPIDQMLTVAAGVKLWLMRPCCNHDENDQSRRQAETFTHNNIGLIEYLWKRSKNIWSARLRFSATAYQIRRARTLEGSLTPARPRVTADTHTESDVNQYLPWMCGD